MKSGTLWVRCPGLVLADFECDPRSSDSGRARRNFVFVFGQVSNTRFRRFPLTKFNEICTQHIGRWDGEFFWKRISKILLSKKRNIFREKNWQLVTSGCHNSTTIVDRQKLTTKWAFYRMSTFYFYHWNQFRVIPLASTVRTWRVLSHPKQNLLQRPYHMTSRHAA